MWTADTKQLVNCVCLTRNHGRWRKGARTSSSLFFFQLTKRGGADGGSTYSAGRLAMPCNQVDISASLPASLLSLFPLQLARSPAQHSYVIIEQGRNGRNGRLHSSAVADVPRRVGFRSGRRIPQQREDAQSRPPPSSSISVRAASAQSAIAAHGHDPAASAGNPAADIPGGYVVSFSRTLPKQQQQQSTIADSVPAPFAVAVDAGRRRWIRPQPTGTLRIRKFARRWIGCRTAAATAN